MHVNSVAGLTRRRMEQKVCCLPLSTIQFAETISFIAYLRSVVTDGVSIGRPACMKHDCMNTLNSVKDHYCPEHLMLNRLCVVTTCSSPVEEDHHTCAIPEHRKLEDYNAMQNKAMFQLKHQLAHLKTSQPQSSFGDSDLIAPLKATLTNEEVLIDKNGICDGKLASGNTTVQARFGRRKTHNEELCVASCGVILGRATFYGSEAPNSILVTILFRISIISFTDNTPRNSRLDSSLPKTCCLKSCGMITTVEFVSC